MSDASSRVSAFVKRNKPVPWPLLKYLFISMHLFNRTLPLAPVANTKRVRICLIPKRSVYRFTFGAGVAEVQYWG